MTPTRTHPTWVTQTTKDHLNALLHARDPAAYRTTMQALGGDLGRELQPRLPNDGLILFVVTVEDADFLGRGVLDALQLGTRAALFCYWNERNIDRETAPIVSRYEERLAAEVSAIVVMKSVVSGACVVRTNLAEAMEQVHHDVPVFVLAPVMHVDADKKLRKEFTPAVAARFSIVTCAVDSDKDGDIIRPGVGGSVYDLLGLTDVHAKNRYRPRIVAERQALYAS